MGRLPATFANRQITARMPQGFAGELAVTSAQTGQQFQDATFLNSTDRPFEIHRLVPFVIAQDSNSVALSPQPAQDLLMSLVRVRILDLGKTQQLMKSSTLIRTLVKGSAELTWEFADPYYLAKGEQLQVTLDALTFPANAVIANLQFLSVALNFQGFFISIAPPSDAR